MKEKNCPEFQAWLDRLPSSEPTEEMKQHFAACARCQKLFESLSPLVQALCEIPSPVKLSDDKIKKLTAVAEKEARRIADRKTAWELSRNIVMGLPFVMAIHWLWLGLGSKALAGILSPLIAQILTAVIIVVSSLAAALIFGAIPLLWATLRRNL